MEKRDLKADLEKLKSHEENDVHFMSLVKYNKFLVAKVLNKQKRSKQLEALVRELVDMLGRVTPRYLAGRLELDLDLVHEANGLLKKAKEVLGDVE